MCSPCVSFALLPCFRHSVAPNVRMLCQRCKVRNLNQRPCQNRDANQHGRHTSICATRPVLNAVMVVYLLQRLLQRPVSHHVGGPGSRGTEQLESRHQNTHGENEDGRTHPHLHLFWVARRVQMVMHAMWMINNEGTMKHTGLSKLGKEATSGHMVRTHALLTL